MLLFLFFANISIFIACYYFIMIFLLTVLFVTLTLTLCNLFSSYTHHDGLYLPRWRKNNSWMHFKDLFFKIFSGNSHFPWKFELPKSLACVSKRGTRAENLRVFQIARFFSRSLSKHVWAHHVACNTWYVTCLCLWQRK